MGKGEGVRASICAFKGAQFSPSRDGPELDVEQHPGLYPLSAQTTTHLAYYNQKTSMS